MFIEWEHTEGVACSASPCTILEDIDSDRSTSKTKTLLLENDAASTVKMLLLIGPDLVVGSDAAWDR